MEDSDYSSGRAFSSYHLLFLNGSMPDSQVILEEATEEKLEEDLLGCWR